VGDAADVTGEPLEDPSFFSPADNGAVSKKLSPDLSASAMLLFPTLHSCSIRKHTYVFSPLFNAGEGEEVSDGSNEASIIIARSIIAAG
jgi:hypothetical protein